jgi:transcriptional regulator with XRE-family HTH domain
MSDTIREAVAAALRAEMARQRMDQRTLAARVGRSQTWVQYRASGRVACDVEDLALLAEALDVPVSRFLPDEVAA